MINKLSKKVVNSREWWERFQEREEVRYFGRGKCWARGKGCGSSATERGVVGLTSVSPKLFHNIVLAKCYRFLIALLLNIIDH